MTFYNRNDLIDEILYEVEQRKLSRRNLDLQNDNLEESFLVEELFHIKGKNDTQSTAFFGITKRDIFDWIEGIIYPLIIVVFFMMFGARIDRVFGISMEPTLLEQDRIVVLSLSKFDYGDIVIIDAKNLPNRKTGEMGEPIVKRVIGLPGDVIFIDAETGDVYRNGEILIEDYIMEKILPHRIGNQSYPVTVPEGKIFVLGDNRNHSTDSREGYEEGAVYFVDFVDERYVLGKAAFRVFPLNRIGGL